MKHILYTEEEGNNFHTISKANDEETVAFFYKIIEDQRFDFRTGDYIVKILPSYIALVETVDDYDFVLGGTRIKKEEDAT